MFTVNLFEGIEDEVIQKTLQNIKKNLHKVSCSHLKYHCGQTDEFLQNRIFEENKFASTSFYAENAKEIKALCVKAMEAKWEEVASFLMGGLASYEIQYDFQKSLGFGYLAGINGVFEDIHCVRVSFAKDEDMPFGFVITSVYPVVTRDLQPDTSVDWLGERSC